MHDIDCIPMLFCTSYVAYSSSTSSMVAASSLMASISICKSFEISFYLRPWQQGHFEVGGWLAGSSWCLFVVLLAAFVAVVL